MGCFVSAGQVGDTGAGQGGVVVAGGACFVILSGMLLRVLCLFCDAACVLLEVLLRVLLGVLKVRKQLPAVLVWRCRQVVVSGGACLGMQ